MVELFLLITAFDLQFCCDFSDIFSSDVSHCMSDSSSAKYEEKMQKDVETEKAVTLFINGIFTFIEILCLLFYDTINNVQHS